MLKMLYHQIYHQSKTNKLLEFYICNPNLNEHYFTGDLLRLMVSSMPTHPGTFSVLTQRLEC